jgi:hypothetical protein
MQLLKKLDLHDENEKIIYAATKYVRSYIKAIDSSATFNSNNANTYHSFLHEVEIHELLQKEEALQEALHLYFSIFLNEWFVKAYDSSEEINKFLNFVKTPFYYSNNYKKASYNGYKIAYFETSREQFDLDKTGDLCDARAAKYINNFCISNSANDDVVCEVAQDIMDKSVKSHNEFEWNYGYETFMFDIFKPFMLILRDDDWSNEDETIIQENEQYKVDYMIYAKDVLTNYELQKYIGDKVENLVRTLGRRRVGQLSWKNVCEKFYECVNCDLHNYMDRALHPISNQMKYYFDNPTTNNPTVMENLFLGNDDNKDAYKKEWTEIIENIIKIYNIDNLKKDIINEKISNESLKSYESSIDIKFPNIIGSNASEYVNKKISLENIHSDFLNFHAYLSNQLADIENDNDAESKSDKWSQLKKNSEKTCKAIQKKIDSLK